MKYTIKQWRSRHNGYSSIGVLHITINEGGDRGFTFHLSAFARTHWFYIGFGVQTLRYWVLRKSGESFA